jgi:hypothetical protein
MTDAVRLSIYFYALKPVMQPAITGLLSSITEFFVGQRHQLVQSLPSSIAIVLISTSTASALLVHSNPQCFDWYNTKPGMAGQMAL